MKAPTLKELEDLAKEHCPGDGDFYYEVPFEGSLTANQLARLADIRRMQKQRIEWDLRVIMGLRAEDV